MNESLRLPETSIFKRNGYMHKLIEIEIEIEIEKVFNSNIS